MKLFGAKPQAGAAPQAQGTTPAQQVVPSTGAGIQKLEKGMASLVDLIAPSSVEVDFRYIRVGDRYYATHFMVGYPRYVSASWLAPVPLLFKTKKRMPHHVAAQVVAAQKSIRL